MHSNLPNYVIYLASKQPIGQFAHMVLAKNYDFGTKSLLLCSRSFFLLLKHQKPSVTDYLH